MNFLQPAKKKPQEKNVRQPPGKKGFKSVSPQHKHFVDKKAPEKSFQILKCK